MDKCPLSIFFCLFYPPLNMKGRVSNMSEAIISRRGKVNTGGGGGSGTNRITMTYISNDTFEAPNSVENRFSVLVFGGGGGGGASDNGGGGGGGGNMNRGDITINYGTRVTITIGSGGNGSQYSRSMFQSTYSAPSTGGTSAFGGYLSATGGEAAGGRWYGNGGNGGSGGGGGGQYDGRGGIGYYGGGGGAGTFSDGGRGGTYGGGGGGTITTSKNTGQNSYSSAGRGGTYGGNGGGGTVNPRRGTNTKNWVNVYFYDNKYFTGSGNAGSGITGGGGGFGGNGGYSASASFGGSSWLISMGWFGGGGGGYGGNGGGAANLAGGGGGGFYHDGASATSLAGGGGGGFYGGYAAGGNGAWTASATNGNSGICIIQYYI